MCNLLTLAEEGLTGSAIDSVYDAVTMDLLTPAGFWKFT